MNTLPETNLFKRDFSNFNERELEEVVFSVDWENICGLEKNKPTSMQFFLIVYRPTTETTQLSTREYIYLGKPWVTQIYNCKNAVLGSPPEYLQFNIHNTYVYVYVKINTDQNKSGITPDA